MLLLINAVTTDKDKDLVKEFKNIVSNSLLADLFTKKIQLKGNGKSFEVKFTSVVKGNELENKAEIHVYNRLPEPKNNDQTDSGSCLSSCFCIFNLSRKPKLKNYCKAKITDLVIFFPIDKTLKDRFLLKNKNGKTSLWFNGLYHSFDWNGINLITSFQNSPNEWTEVRFYDKNKALKPDFDKTVKEATNPVCFLKDLFKEILHANSSLLDPKIAQIFNYDKTTSDLRIVVKESDKDVDLDDFLASKDISDSLNLDLAESLNKIAFDTYISVNPTTSRIYTELKPKFIGIMNSLYYKQHILDFLKLLKAKLLNDKLFTENRNSKFKSSKVVKKLVSATCEEFMIKPKCGK